MIKFLPVEAHLSPIHYSHHGPWKCCRSLSGADTLRHSTMMAHTKQSGSGSTVEEMRRSEGHESASSRALADDAIIWASLHGLVQLSLLQIINVIT